MIMLSIVGISRGWQGSSINNSSSSDGSIDRNNGLYGSRGSNRSNHSGTSSNSSSCSGSGSEEGDRN